MEVGYTDWTEVVIAEDFETANRFEPAVTSTANIVRTQSDQWVLDGTSSGLIVLDAEHQVLISSTNEQQYNLQSNGPVWLELDYACTQPFWVGLYVKNAVNAQRIPILVLNSTEGERNKIYLDLDPVVRTSSEAGFNRSTFLLSLGAETTRGTCMPLKNSSPPPNASWNAGEQR